jgi:ribonucleoside-diphosphate reductase alpha chain
MTRNSEIPFAKSLVDYIFRWLAMEFVSGYRAANAPKREPRPQAEEAEEAAEAPAAPEATTGRKGGNGHGSRIEPDSARPFAYSDEEMKASAAGAPAEAPGGSNLRLAIVADPLSQQSSELQADAPACDVCGSITVRNGTCYKCLNCGNSMGCS